MQVGVVGEVLLEQFVEGEGVGPHGVVGVAGVVRDVGGGEELVVLLLPLRHGDVLVESRVIGGKIGIAEGQVAVQSLKGLD